MYLLLLCLCCTSAFAADVLSLRVSGTSAEVSFPSSRNKQYAVEVSDDLETWDPVQEEIFGTGSEIVITHELGGRTRGFYRTQRSDEFSVSIPPALLNVGNEWTYLVTENEDGSVSVYTEVDRVTHVSTQNGIPVFNVASYSNGMTWVGTEYIQQDISEGLFAVGINDPEAGKMFSTPPEPLLYRQFVPGVQRAPLGLTLSDPNWGPVMMQVTQSIDYDPLTVPAGIFTHTVKVEKQVSGTLFGFAYTGGATTWYAMDVGIIKSTTSISIPDAEYEFATASELTSYSLN